MKKYILAISAILLFHIAGLQAQSTGDISGTYFVPKGPSIVEIVRDGSGYKVTQISSTATKEQAHNGKVRAVADCGKRRQTRCSPIGTHSLLVRTDW